MVVACSSGFVQPRLIVRLAWGSRSMSKTSLPFRAKTDAQIQRRAGLAHAALLVGNGNRC